MATKRKAKFKVGQAVDILRPRRVHIEQVQRYRDGFVYYCDDGNVYTGNELSAVRRPTKREREGRG